MLWARWSIVLICLATAAARTASSAPSYGLDEAVALAQTQNLDIAIARKKIEAARGKLTEARAGYLPAVVSSGLLRKREQQSDSRLRGEDYNASVRVVEPIYTGGATTARIAIAQLSIEKQELELRAVSDRVLMDVRIAFHELLLNRAKVRVREQSVRVFEEEVKTQQERLNAGTVGQLNVRRAEVALGNERPELIDAETQLRNSHLRLGELLGIDLGNRPERSTFDIHGTLEYQQQRPDLNESLARADTHRPEIRARQIDVEIEDRQYLLDQSELRPRIDAFSGYEVYSERDPAVGREFNHGYVLGLNASWNIFDGFATQGRMRATRARRDAALQALAAARLSVATDVRSAFLDLQQADRILESESKNVQTADESLEIAKANLSAGLGTQLDVLQAAADVTRTRTTRLGAIYLHNAALAKLARASGGKSNALAFDPRNRAIQKKGEAARSIARPPSKLGQR